LSVINKVTATKEDVT